MHVSSRRGRWWPGGWVIENETAGERPVQAPLQSISEPNQGGTDKSQKPVIKKGPESEKECRRRLGNSRMQCRTSSCTCYNTQEWRIC